MPGLTQTTNPDNVNVSDNVSVVVKESLSLTTTLTHWPAKIPQNISK